MILVEPSRVSGEPGETATKIAAHETSETMGSRPSARVADEAVVQWMNIARISSDPMVHTHCWPRRLMARFVPWRHDASATPARISPIRVSVP